MSEHHLYCRRKTKLASNCDISRHANERSSQPNRYLIFKLFTDELNLIITNFGFKSLNVSNNVFQEMPILLNVRYIFLYAAVARILLHLNGKLTTRKSDNIELT